MIESLIVVSILALIIGCFRGWVRIAMMLALLILLAAVGADWQEHNHLVGLTDHFLAGTCLYLIFAAAGFASGDFVSQLVLQGLGRA